MPVAPSSSPSVKPGWRIYAEELSVLGHGNPLWFPEPDNRGPIRVGDVGFLDQGHFRRMLNIFEPAESQRREFNHSAPTGFKPAPLLDIWKNFDRNHLSKGQHSAGESVMQNVKPSVDVSIGEEIVSIGANYSRGTSKNKLATLVTKCDSHKESVQENKIIQRYFEKNHKHWYKWITKDLALSGIDKKDIILIHGAVKSPHCRMEASVIKGTSHKPVISGGGDALSVDINASLEYEKVKVHFRSPEGREVPEEFVPPSNVPSQPDTMPEAWDKCLFFDGWKLKSRFPFQMKAAAGPHELPPAADPDLAPAVESGDLYTPLDALLDYILRNSNVDEAIASDGALRELLGEGNTARTAGEVAEFLQQHRPIIEVDDGNTGSLSLADILKRSFASRARHTFPDPSSPSPRSGPTNKFVHDGTLVLPKDSGGTKELFWPHFALVSGEGGVGPQASVTLSPTDATMAVTGGEDGNVNVWDIHSGKLLKNYSGQHEDSVSQAMFSPDGTRVVTFGEDLRVIVWSVTETRELEERGDLGDGGKYIHSMHFSPDSKILATADSERDVRLWDVDTLEELPGLGNARKHRNVVIVPIAFSPDGEKLATASWNKIHLWNTRDGQSLGELVGADDQVNSFCFSSDSRRIIAGSGDNVARIWNVETREDIVNVSGFDGAISVVTFSPDGTKAAICGQDSRIVVIDSSTGAILHELRDDFRFVNALTWSRNGQYLVSTSQAGYSPQGVVKLWSMASGTLLATFKGHQEPAKQLEMTANDRGVVSFSENDASARVWEFDSALRLVEVV